MINELQSGPPVSSPRQPADTTALFSPISPGRVSGEIVNQIKVLIQDGTLQPGDRLPSERRLTEAFGVSRVTVRDGLRFLEANGLVEIRVGSGGGAFITAPEPHHVAEGLGYALALRSISAEDVTETRLIVEMGLLPLIADRVTESDIAELLDICDRADASWASGDYDVLLSAEFHTRLASASHNDATAMIVAGLHGPLVSSLVSAKQVAPQMGQLGVVEHRQIVEALRERDADRARHLMAAHLARTAERLRQPRGN